MLISRGDIRVFVERPISAVFIALCAILILAQLYFRLFSKGKRTPGERVEQPMSAE
jgi:TctA family transporter